MECYCLCVDLGMRKIEMLECVVRVVAECETSEGTTRTVVGDSIGKKKE